jgi:hypothetical protein
MGARPYRINDDDDDDDGKDVVALCCEWKKCTEKAHLID